MSKILTEFRTLLGFLKLITKKARRGNICPTYGFRQELLSHGNEIEVLSPQWFRNELATITKEIAQQYKKK